MKFIISTPSSDLKSSSEFYAKAGFDVLESNGKTFVLDGPLIIELDKAKTARPGLKFYGKLDKGTRDELDKFGIIFENELFYLTADPSGTWVYFMKEAYPEIGIKSEECKSVFGKYSGVSIECIDMKKALDFYKLLGFESTMGSVDAGWISMANNDGGTISIMGPMACPHMFTNPSLTYFNNGKNLENIRKIRDVGIPISEEITVFNDKNIVDNVILHEPGGLGFFVFND